MFDLQGWFQWLMDSFWDLTFDLLIALVVIFQDLIIFLTKSSMDLFASLVGTYTSTFSLQQYWGLLPADIRAVLNAIMIPQALALISSAFLLKRLLKLIPYLRG